MPQPLEGKTEETRMFKMYDKPLVQPAAFVASFIKSFLIRSRHWRKWNNLVLCDPNPKPMLHEGRNGQLNLFLNFILFFLSSLSELSFSKVESKQFLCLTWSFPKEVPVNFVRWAVFVPMLCYFFFFMMWLLPSSYLSKSCTSFLLSVLKT